MRQLPIIRAALSLHYSVGQKAEKMNTALNSAFCYATTIIVVLCFTSFAEARPFRLLVHGDSLSSGFGLPEQAGFPSVFSRCLHADGYRDVLVYNGSIAGETTTEAVQRLASALEIAPDLIIIELGGNDMLDRTDPGVVHANLDYIIGASRKAGARVILAGMLALPKFGKAYTSAFDAICPTLAVRYKIPLFHFSCRASLGARCS